MNTREELQERLDELRREYKGLASMLSMMEKGTRREDLAKMRREQLDPVQREISRLEGELAGSS